MEVIRHMVDGITIIMHYAPHRVRPPIVLSRDLVGKEIGP